jgi:hypothetical protein
MRPPDSVIAIGPLTFNFRENSWRVVALRRCHFFGVEVSPSEDGNRLLVIS